MSDWQFAMAIIGIIITICTTAVVAAVWISAHISSVKVSISGVEGSVRAVGDKVDHLRSTIDRVDARVDDHAERITRIEAGL